MKIDLKSIEDATYQFLSTRDEESLNEEKIQKGVLDILDVYHPGVKIQEKELTQIVRQLMQRLEIDMVIGEFFAANYQPWLDEKRKDINWLFSDRYNRFLTQENFSQKVVNTINQDTDQILDLTEDPKKEGSWSRRGLVVGHVQSGKTANYTGLICKAADAGYKLIIILAGMSNDLRNQTQSRADEGFVGIDTSQIGSSANFKALLKGVGKIDRNLTADPLTTSKQDFHRVFAQQYKSLSNSNQPFFAVIKKNKYSFDNLISWLTSLAPSFDDIPLLLIDDEADHASINTSKPELDPTTINKKINELLSIFPKNIYVGYTATPFANVFISPSESDIFPEDFIYSLATPSNYIGPDEIFGSDESFDIVRTIPIEEYYEDVMNDIISPFLPLKHKKDHELDSLPPSLEEAIMIYILSCAERNLRGQRQKHKSMMINVSVFKDVQHIVKDLTYQFLATLKAAVNVNFALEDEALEDFYIKRFHKLYLEEFKDLNWDLLLKELKNSISPIQVIEVNTSVHGESLSYDENDWPNGRSVIALGGYALSRGLTLEGLSVSYLLRNTQMYDTLMQMGRWFGYRHDYEELCRIYLPEDSRDWYEYITEATDELREEFRKMRRANMTPKEFGLRVRNHPATLLITAKNKMRSGELVIDRAINLYGRQIETSVLSTNLEEIDKNTEAAKVLIDSLNKKNTFTRDKSGFLFSEVSYLDIISFINSYSNHPLSHLTESKPIKDYIDLIAKESINKWDLLIVSSEKVSSDLNLNLSGFEIKAAKRTVVKNNSNYITNKSKRFASANWEKAGLDSQSLKEIQDHYKSIKKKSIPGHAYRSKRKYPLLVIYFLDCHIKGSNEKISDDGILAWSISFPGETGDKNDQWVQYYQNVTMQQQDLFQNFETDEEDYE
jgi:hypothetical protein